MNARVRTAVVLAAGLWIGGARVAGAHCGANLCQGGLPNGMLEAGEQCDDGDNLDCTNGCNKDCSLNNGLCGDCHVCGGEACDDGNTVNTDGCNNACTSTNACGNGIIDTNVGEECDNGLGDGLPDNGTHENCTDACRCSRCGDGRTDMQNNNDTPACPLATNSATEICDDGNTVGTDACNAACTSNNTCGNGITDGVVGETCDDGDTNNCDGCTTRCLASTTCGDGFVCGIEVCDDGDTLPGGACNATCTSNNTCGNGITDTGVGEECDNKNPTCVGGTVHGSSCTSLLGTINCYTALGSCHVGGAQVCCDKTFAGISFLGGNVTCDGTCDVSTQANCPFDPSCLGITCVACNSDYNANACRSTCQAAGCGDGVADAGEVCDDGLRNDGLDDADSCPNGPNTVAFGAACRVSETCGNGIPRLVDSSASCAKPNAGVCGTNCASLTEECDAGIGTACINNAVAPVPKRCLENPTQTCTTDSAGCHCGNDNTAPDHCRTTCKAPSCPDGVTDTGEECDDGDTVDGDGCNTNPNVLNPDCSLPFCGDGTIDAGEGCDDGNTNNCDACTTKCQPPACGDGFLCAPETCDDGNLLPNDNCSPGCTKTYCGDGDVNTAGCNGNPACTSETCGTIPEQCDPGICGDNPAANCSGGCCLWDADTSGAPPSPGAAASLAALRCCLEDLQQLTVQKNVGGLAPRVQKIRDRVGKKLPGSSQKKTCAGVRSVAKKISQLARKIDITGATAADQQALQDNRGRCARWNNRYGDINACTPIF